MLHFCGKMLLHLSYAVKLVVKKGHMRKLTVKTYFFCTLRESAPFLI